MTLPRLYSLSKYWADHPPVHILLAAFMGIKPQEKEEPNMEEMIALFGDAGILKK